jgi:ABC-2 type transport system permease protein
MLRLYLRLISIRIRSQMQYPLSFLFDTIGSGFGTLSEFISLWAVLTRFGTIGNWTMPEVALLYGLAETSFATMDMIFSGYDPTFFSTQIQRGMFDQMLLRPLSLPVQIFGSELIMRRLGRISQGAGVLLLSLYLNPIQWSPTKVILILIVLISTIAFFGGLFVIGATLCFWTVEALEAVNIFTYGGTTMISYPMHIYGDWMRRFFTFVIPAALLTYYPALYLLDKPDPLGLPLWMPFLSPAAGFLTLALAFAFWRFGVLHYQSTGS